MFDDYPVSPLSNLEVTALAKRTRKYFGVADARRIDVIACAKCPRIWTVRGERWLRFEVRPTSEMGESDGLTTYEGDRITIATTPSVHHDAYMGVGRFRNTFAHEIGHAVMHDGAPKHRRAQGNLTYKSIKTYESAEHQAKIFAPAFMINDEIAETLSSAEEIAIEFEISFESATIYFEQITEVRNRPKSTQNVLRMAEEFKAIATPSTTPKLVYMKDPCNICSQATVFPVGHKFMCQTCETVYDRFQDGDTLEF